MPALSFAVSHSVSAQTSVAQAINHSLVGVALVAASLAVLPAPETIASTMSATATETLAVNAISLGLSGNMGATGSLLDTTEEVAATILSGNSGLSAALVCVAGAANAGTAALAPKAAAVLSDTPSGTAALGPSLWNPFVAAQMYGTATISNFSGGVPLGLNAAATGSLQDTGNEGGASTLSANSTLSCGLAVSSGMALNASAAMAPSAVGLPAASIGSTANVLDVFEDVAISTLSSSGSMLGNIPAGMTGTVSGTSAASFTPIWFWTPSISVAGTGALSAALVQVAGAQPAAASSSTLSLRALAAVAPSVTVSLTDILPDSLASSDSANSTMTVQGALPVGLAAAATETTTVSLAAAISSTPSGTGALSPTLLAAFTPSATASATSGLSVALVNVPASSMGDTASLPDTGGNGISAAVSSSGTLVDNVVAALVFAPSGTSALNPSSYVATSGYPAGNWPTTGYPG